MSSREIEIKYNKLHDAIEKLDLGLVIKYIDADYPLAYQFRNQNYCCILTLFRVVGTKNDEGFSYKIKVGEKIFEYILDKYYSGNKLDEKISGHIISALSKLGTSQKYPLDTLAVNFFVNVLKRYGYDLEKVYFNDVSVMNLFPFLRRFNK